MVNYWFCDAFYDDDGSWFGLRATAERLRRTKLGHAKTKWMIPRLMLIGACVTSFVRRHVSATGM